MSFILGEVFKSRGDFINIYCIYLANYFLIRTGEPRTLQEPRAVAQGVGGPRPDPGRPPRAEPSAPPRWAAFGGPRSSPASAAEVPAMGAPIGCATRRSGRPRPRGPPGVLTPRGRRRRRGHSVLEDFVLGLRPPSRWGGRERAAMELRLPLEMSPGRKAACRAVFGTWGFFRTMHGKTAPSC